jgi:hypothetical protein
MPYTRDNGGCVAEADLRKRTVEKTSRKNSRERPNGDDQVTVTDPMGRNRSSPLEMKKPKRKER